MKRLLILLAAVMLLGGMTGCGGGAEADELDGRRGGPGGARGSRGTGGPPARASEDDSVSVKGARAERSEISKYIVSNTSLESIRKVSVIARVNSLVDELLVEEGARVMKDQVLIRLDGREIRNEYEQARIAVDQAVLNVEQAAVKAKLSEANYKRFASLLEQTLISPQEFEQTALSNETDALGLKVSAQQLDAAKARLAAAQIQVEYTEILAPIDGVVTERLVEVGSRVSANEIVFTVQDFNPLWARIFVPEKDLVQIALGQVARVKFQALPEQEYQGKIIMISPTVDPESGTAKITLEVNQRGTTLRPGMFGTVLIATETHNDAVVVPKRAVVRERDENRVFVVKEDGTVEKRGITLGFTEEDRVEVVEGLRPDEIVVTVGQEGLNDGYPVNVLAWEEGSNPVDIVRPAPSPTRAEGASAGPPGSGDTRAEEGGRRRGGQGGRAGGRGPGGGNMEAFLERMLQNPEIKKAYDAKLKENPKFMEDPEERRKFFTEMRGLMGRNP